MPQFGEQKWQKFDNSSFIIINRLTVNLHIISVDLLLIFYPKNVGEILKDTLKSQNLKDTPRIIAHHCCHPYAIQIVVIVKLRAHTKKCRTHAPWRLICSQIHQYPKLYNYIKNKMKIIKNLVIPSLNDEVMQKLYRNEIFVQISCLACFFGNKQNVGFFIPFFFFFTCPKKEIMAHVKKDIWHKMCMRIFKI